jgi:6-phosphofructokinase
MKVGILTAGGVCPGVNNIIHTLTRLESARDNRVIGINEGFRGVNNKMRVDLDIKKIREGPGSVLRVSCDKVDVERAVKNIRDLDKLYCICGNESMKGAKQLALDDRIDTNIVGIAKTIFNDIPGIESLGFQTAVQEFAKYIDHAYVEATTTNSIVFVEAPGLNVTGLATQATYARYSKVTDIVTPETVNKIKMHQIKNNYEVNGYATVIISESCNYEDIIKFLDDEVDTEVKIMKPGFSIRDVEPCFYDTILSHQMAVVAFQHSHDHRNFIKGATNIVHFEDFLNIG